MKPYVTSTALLAAVFAASVSAQPENVERTAKADSGLTLQAAVRAAVQHYPSLRGSRIRVLKAGEGVDAAQANYWPSIDIGVSSQASDDDISGYDSHYVHTAQLTASQLLYDFGQTASKVDRAQAKKQVARIKVRQTYAKVVRNTATAWLKVRRNQALVAVAEKRLAAIEELTQLAKKREALGAGTHSDTVQAKARLDAARARLVSARARVQRWRSNLKHWIGSGALPNVTGTMPAELVSACKQIDGAHAVRQSAAVRHARALVRVARANEDVAATRMRPTLSLNASLSHDLGSSSRRTGEDGLETTVTLGLSMPLFQGGRLRSNQQAAIYGVQVARASLQQTRLTMQRQLRSAMVQWRRFHRLLDVQQQRIESMRVTRSLYRQQYLKLGTRSLLDLLNAEQEYYGALSDRLKSKYKLYKLGLTCLYATGRLHDRFANTATNVAHATPGTTLLPSAAYELPKLP